MADSTPNQNEQRPLLAFNQPYVTQRARGQGNNIPLGLPGGRRRGDRLYPQFQALQDALRTPGATSSLSDTPEASDPECVVVFELAKSVKDFMRAANKVDGLEFLTEYLGDGIVPDDDFYNLDNGHSKNETKPVRQSIYLTMSNRRAIDQIVTLFNKFQENEKTTFDTGLNPWKDVFKALHTVRKWGPKDRVAETGLEEDFRERLRYASSETTFQVEIELNWRTNPVERLKNQRRIEQLIGDSGVLSSCVIEAIGYHGILADLPVSQVQRLVDSGPESVEVLRSDSVLLVSPAKPMSYGAHFGVEKDGLAASGVRLTGKPKVALLDGLPLVGHVDLQDRLIVDDPEDVASRYLMAPRGHGTAMASIVVHGDLSKPDKPISSPLLVHPVLEPNPFDDNIEEIPAGHLFIDVIHSGFQRLFGGESPSAPSVRVVNLSLGEQGRVYIRRMSPLARLIDYLIVKHNILVIISAGNQDRSSVVRSNCLDDPKLLDKAVRSSLHAKARSRRILSPAETMNALTVGATHDDASDIEVTGSALEPLLRGAVADYSPMGGGIKKSPKPEVLLPGGRSIVMKPLTTTTLDTTLKHLDPRALGPGVLTAAPTSEGARTGRLYSTGTSNAAALATHYAHHVLDHLEELSARDELFPGPQYHPIMTRTILIHASGWPKSRSDNGFNRSVLTQIYGCGVMRPEQLLAGSTRRVTLIKAGSILKDQCHKLRFPLPTSLVNKTGQRRLTVTLTWFSPTVSKSLQYRVATLEFVSPKDYLPMGRIEVDHNSNGKGTVIHETLEAKRTAVFTNDDHLPIDINCREQVGKLTQPIRYAIAVTLEVGTDVQIDADIDLHSEVRNKLRLEQKLRAPVPTR